MLNDNYKNKESEKFWLEFNARRPDSSQDTLDFRKQVKVKSFFRKGKHGAIVRVQSFRKKAAIRERKSKDYSKRTLRLGKKELSLGKRRVLGEGFQGKVIDYNFNTVRKQATPALFRNTKRATQKEANVATLAGKSKIGPKVRKVGENFIDMEKLKGKTVSKKLEGAGKGRQRKLGTQTGKAVARLHEAGIQHRDLHLENLYDSGGIKVIDYGFAKKKRQPLSPRQARVDVKRVESKAKAMEADEFVTSFKVSYEKNRKRNFSKESGNFWLEFEKHKEQNIEFARRKGKPLSAAHKAKISRSLKNRNGNSELEEEEESRSVLQKVGSGFDKSVDRVNRSALALNRATRAGTNIGGIYRTFRPKKKTNLQKTGDALNIADKVYRRGIAGSNQANRWTTTLTRQRRLGSASALVPKTTTKYDKAGKVVSQIRTTYDQPSRVSKIRYAPSLGSQVTGIFSGGRRR